MVIAGIFAMSTQVKSGYNDTELVQIFRKGFVATHMLGHAVGNLQHAFDLPIRLPNIPRENRPIVSGKFK